MNQTKLGDDSEFPTLALVVEQKDGNRWCVSVVSDSQIEGITDKDVRIFGTYQEFSDVVNLPELAVSVEDEELMEKARIEIEENEKWVEVWNFYTNYENEEVDRPESSIDSSEDTGNSGNIAGIGGQNTENDRNKEIYLEEAPGSEENILQSVMIESEKTNNGDIVVFITNNNPYSIPDIDELEYIVVFYNENAVMDTSHPNDIRDVKAGSVAIEKVPVYRMEFDGYEIYINQAHTFFNSDGEVIKDTIPENIGKGYIYPTSKEES